jgi:hypothetical protein
LVSDVPNSVAFPALLTACQVTPYTSPNRQSRHHRSRPVPQPQPSPRSLLFRPPTYTCSSIAPEHLQVPQERLPILHSSAQKRRSPHALVRPRRPPPKHLPNRPRPRSQLSRQAGLGEIHTKSHRHRSSEAYKRRGVPGLGQTRGT